MAMKGKKQVGTLTSTERATLFTTVICISAAWTVILPIVIFPTSPFVSCLPSFWLDVVEPFRKVIQLFFLNTKNTNASKDNPLLLIMGGHKTFT